MNIYGVLSEEICPTTSSAALEPECPFAVVSIVRAKNREQARYMAAREEREYDVWPWEGYKFWVRVLEKDVQGEPAILSADPNYQHLWSHANFPVDPMAMEKERKEIDDLILGMLLQGSVVSVNESGESIVDNMYISIYEEACLYLERRNRLRGIDYRLYKILKEEEHG
jgi:hypothetical protein